MRTQRFHAKRACAHQSVTSQQWQPQRYTGDPAPTRPPGTDIAGNGGLIAAPEARLLIAVDIRWQSAAAMSGSGWRR
jgi:hypothetical protein